MSDLVPEFEKMGADLPGMYSITQYKLHAQCLKVGNKEARKTATGARKEANGCAN